IDGSLKDSVGIKNPYRYRGYRYDNETGLYYLQSRYYNPEWGRFINADAIAGKIGELRGHNLFIYCKNNSINGKDPSGFRMVFADDETQRQYEQWVRNQSQITTSVREQVSSNVINVGKSAGSNIVNTGMDTVATVITAKYIKTGSKYVEFGSLTLGKFVEKNPLGAFLKTTTCKVGVTSIIGIFISASANFKQYDFKGAIGRTAIDVLFVGGAVGATVLIPGVGFAAAIGIGVIAEAASRGSKKIIYGDSFWN
ncbi:MAG: RHS repeat-associated core domain-containing protein, partial [Clostridium sp.]|nr:RHS repeat-associated core domain-containing protein [Clostridium sp.]